MELRKALVVSGIVSSVLYAAMLVFVPLRWDAYSSASQTVSELAALGAPTRSPWVALAVVWTLLYAAFGLGAWAAGRESRALRVAGVLIVVQGLFGLFWPPMHQREVLAAGGKSLTDTLHIVWTIVNGLLTVLEMGFAAAALGRRFRLYSVATVGVLLAAGLATARDAPGLDANLPTPWMGVWERVNIGAWLLWVAALSVALLRLKARPRRAE